jgi:hypothetical protein
MMDELLKLEREVQAVYEETLRPVARRLACDVPVRLQDAASQPMVLFLGNHSSGKSSYINTLVGAEVQKTGLAPTDDGFTLLTWGEKADEFDGQTVVSHPELPYQQLQQLGPVFLSRLRLKTHPSELLKAIRLVDSPGMIDAAGTDGSRGYDFAAAVRSFAEMADLILFFFDPDKPGTTGETVSIFTGTLVGLEHKLLIVMNKVDLFSNIRDFARTTGTLCWNLSRTMKTKDVPHIFNTYLPGHGRATGDGMIPLRDFDASREEVIAEIKRAPTRRADNLVSDLLVNARLLAMQGRVCLMAARRYRAWALRIWGGAFLVWVVAAGAVGLALNAERWTTLGIVTAVALLASAGAWWGGKLLLRRWEAQARGVDGLEPSFAAAYRRELTWHDRADLRALWERVRPKARKSLELLGAHRLPAGRSFRKQLRRLDDVVDKAIPKLRRGLARARIRATNPGSATAAPSGD